MRLESGDAKGGVTPPPPSERSGGVNSPPPSERGGGSERGVATAGFLLRRLQRKETIKLSVRRPASPISLPAPAQFNGEGVVGGEGAQGVGAGGKEGGASYGSSAPTTAARFETAARAPTRCPNRPPPRQSSPPARRTPAHSPSDPNKKKAAQNAELTDGARSRLERM